MAEPETISEPDEFERFDEAQPFLQLLANMLDRIVSEQQVEGEDSGTVDDRSTE